VTENGGVNSPEFDSAGDEQQEVRIRRAPRIGVFVSLGVVLGVIGTLIATSLFEPDPAIGFTATFGYFLIYGVPAGALLGSTVALILDAVSRRRARTATATRTAPPAA
jgi:hypothetical protein